MRPNFVIMQNIFLIRGFSFKTLKITFKVTFMTDIFSIGIKIRFKGKKKLEARRPVT